MDFDGVELDEVIELTQSNPMISQPLELGELCPRHREVAIHRIISRDAKNLLQSGERDQRKRDPCDLAFGSGIKPA